MSRVDRVAQAIKEEISVILHGKLNDPRIGFVTIMRVELADDLRFAKVFYSVLGKEEDYKKTKAALDSSLGFIRREVAHRLGLRFAPELLFKEDRSTEYGVRIEQILQEIKQEERQKDEPKRRKQANKKKK